MIGPRAPDVLLGSDAAAVQDSAAMRSAFAFSVGDVGCTGSSFSWALARDLLIATPAYNCIVLAYVSRPIGINRIRYPVTVIGDGAFAMTMRSGGRPALRAHRMEMDGAFHDLFHVDYRMSPWYEWREHCDSPDRYRFELALKSRNRLLRMVEEVLEQARISKSDVAATLMQNVTAGAFEFYELLLGLKIHHVCRDNLRRHGHLGAMDVVLNLHSLLEEGCLRTGQYVLVINNSPVAAWAVTLWEI
jgi:3-oxoacyl-[acyl-carrier-protein] synthase-3